MSRYKPKDPNEDLAILIWMLIAIGIFFFAIAACSPHGPQ